jgi:hypothetical protein
MDEATQAAEPFVCAAPAGPERCALPPLSNAERDFWRRAVEIERRRQRCGRPTPFPFQPT